MTIRCDLCGRPKEISQLGWVRPDGVYDVSRPMFVCSGCKQKLLRSSVRKSVEKFSPKSRDRGI